MAITAASCALCLSDIPFLMPIAAVRVGLVDGKLKVFPTLAETEAGARRSSSPAPKIPS